MCSEIIAFRISRLQSFYTFLVWSRSCARLVLAVNTSPGCVILFCNLPQIPGTCRIHQLQRMWGWSLKRKSSPSYNSKHIKEMPLAGIFLVPIGPFHRSDGCAFNSLTERTFWKLGSRRNTEFWLVSAINWFCFLKPDPQERDVVRIIIENREFWWGWDDVLR